MGTTSGPHGLRRGGWDPSPGGLERTGGRGRAGYAPMSDEANIWSTDRSAPLTHA